MAPFHFNSLFRPTHVTLTPDPPQGSHSSRSPTLRSIISYIDDPYYRSPTTDSEHGHDPSHSHSHAHTALPNFDIHETVSAYFLEGEFPGIADKEAIMIERLGRRGLLIEARVGKCDLVSEWGGLVISPPAAVSQTKAPDQSNPDNVAPPNTADGKDVDIEAQTAPSTASGKGDAAVSSGPASGQAEGEDLNARSLLAERHEGYLQRSFTFPHAVEFGGLRARLRNGLLCIMVPKTHRNERREGDRFWIED